MPSGEVAIHEADRRVAEAKQRYDRYQEARARMPILRGRARMAHYRKIREQYIAELEHARAVRLSWLNAPKDAREYPGGAEGIVAMEQQERRRVEEIEMMLRSGVF